MFQAEGRPELHDDRSHEKRNGSHPETTGQEENDSHSLRHKVSTSYQEGSKRRRKRTNKQTDRQSEITAFAGEHTNDTRQVTSLSGGEREKKDETSVIIATLQRIEKKMEDDRKQNSEVNRQLLSEMSEMRKENALLRNKIKALEKKHAPS